MLTMVTMVTMRARLRACVLGMVLLHGLPQAAQAQTGRDTATRVWHDLTVPAGAASAGAAAGIGGSLDPWRLMIEVVRRLHAEPPDSKDAAARLARFTAYLDTTARATTRDTVPLPLSPAIWTATLANAPSGPALFRAITTDRRAAFLYYGLAGLDLPTLRFFADNAALLGTIYRDAAATFASAGRSIRIADGHVLTPGGKAGVALWEHLVGARVAAPAQFVRSLLDRDAGRLAAFYDTVSHLSEGQERFALGLQIPAAGRRQQRFDDLYRVFVRSNPDWDARLKPFSRPPMDPGVVLSRIRTTEAGRPLGPAWRSLWGAIFSDNAAVTRRPGNLDDRDLVDAAWLVNEICLVVMSPKAQRERLDTLLFAQRAFTTAARSQAADLVTAIRSFATYPALMLTFDRLGFTDPALYGRAAARASQLMSGGEPAETRTAIAQFQATLALIERSRFAGTLPGPEALDLVQSLVAVEPNRSGQYAGTMATWLDRVFLPALAARVKGLDGSLTADAVLIRALAGMSGAPPPAAHTLTWEGAPYIVDAAGTEVRRLQHVRERQRTKGLDAVLALAPTTGKLAAGARDLPKAADNAKAPVAVADAHLADALTAFAYAASLGDPDGAALMTADVSRRHDFGLHLPSLDARTRMAWALPSEQSGSGTPWHVTGSLLGLDIALAGLSLRRISTDSMPRPPQLSGADARAFAQAVALMNPLELRDRDRDDIAAAIGRGREAVTTRSRDGRALQELARNTGVAEWRMGMLPWVADNDPDRAATLFSLAELFWVGSSAQQGDESGAASAAVEPHVGPAPSGFAGLRPWGSSALPATGCQCLEFGPPASWERLTGRNSTAVLALQAPDMKLRVAEVLSDLKLPAALAKGVLAGVTQDLLDEAAPLNGDDWFSIAAAARDWPRERIEDHIAALTAVGPLVPATDHEGLQEPR